MTSSHFMIDEKDDKKVNSAAMDRQLWQLYAAVCDLAQSHRPRGLEVHYVDSGDEVEIDLTTPPTSERERWHPVATGRACSNVRPPR